MQVSVFMNRSFVIHKVFLDGVSSKFSVWADPDGTLRDAERIDSLGRSYRINPKSALWADLEKVTKRCAPAIAKNGPDPRHSDYGGSPWTP